MDMSFKKKFFNFKDILDLENKDSVNLFSFKKMNFTVFVYLNIKSLM
jgi:hypothetical protein